MSERRSLSQWLAYLETLHPKAIDMGLERIALVAQRLGLQRPGKRVVSVAGTNGKGSTCAFLAALLEAQGLRVGVYSSPHLLRYNERVQIQGREASDEALCGAFEAVEAARGATSLTYFEVGTLAALWLFQRADLDVAILEVGLGGRLDAVNLVDADVALLTSIAIDHAEWLGNTREAIAVEKAGIWRSGRPALCGDPEPPAVLTAYAKAHAVPLRLRGQDFGLELGETDWTFWGVQLNGEKAMLSGLPLLDLPMQNAALALQALWMLGLTLPRAKVEQALLATRVTGRLDLRVVNYLGRRRVFLLDVAHNPHAAVYLASRLKPLANGGKRLAVFGLLADKDLPGVVAPLLGQVQDWAVASLPSERTLPGEKVRDVLLAAGAEVSLHESLEAALQAQSAKAGEWDQILVFGSFYCVGTALDWLT